MILVLQMIDVNYRVGGIKMKRKHFLLIAVIALTGLILLNSSCVKEEFDTPPVYTSTTSWEKTLTIQQLKALYTGSADLVSNLAPSDYWKKIYDEGSNDTIMAIIIDGYVLSSDSAGNFYETVTIADETGGIDLKINGSDLYATYGLKPGKRVLVRVDNLVLDNYNGMYQVGLGYYDGGVLKVTGIDPSKLSSSVRVTGEKIALQPEKITIPTLNTGLVQKFVKLDSVQFWNPAVTYSIPGENTNRIIIDKDGNQIILRNSGYAKFAKSKLPEGSGSITGILSIYGGTYQFLIRDSSDVNFNQPRFGSQIPEKNTTIEQLKLFYDGSNLYKIPYNLVIEAVVTANDESGNLYKQLFIEDETGAIEFKVDVTGLYADFPVGTKIRISCKDLYMGKYGGVLQLGGEFNGSIGRLSSTEFYKRVYAISTDNPVNVTETTIAEISDELIGKVITLSGVQFADSELGKTYAESSSTTNRILEDDLGNTVLVRTSNYANFANVELPSGKGKLTAVLSKYNSDYQLYIRKVGEVRLIEPRTVKNFLLNQDFSSMPENQDINSDGWKSIAVEGSKNWYVKSYYGNYYARMSAYKSGDASNVVWLVSPKVTIPSGVDTYLKFNTEYGYWAGATLEAYISMDYDGTNPQTATWTKLDAQIAKEADGQWNWVNSGNINLKEFAGDVYIGFKYTGSNSLTTTFDVDNVMIYSLQ
jgi:hypothetical protein